MVSNRLSTLIVTSGIMSQMEPVYKKGTVSTRCAGCGGALASYTNQISGHDGNAGIVVLDFQHFFGKKGFSRILYILLRCGGCGRGGLAVVHDTGQVHDGTLE